MYRLSEEQVIQRTKNSHLEVIKELNFCGRCINDINILKQMPGLEVVSLTNNSINTLEPLMHCTKIRTLFIRNNQIKNIDEITYLKNLPELQELHLSGNPCAERADYRSYVFRALPNLKILDDLPYGVDKPVEVKRAGAAPVVSKAQQAREAAAVRKAEEAREATAASPLPGARWAPVREPRAREALPLREASTARETSPTLESPEAREVSPTRALPTTRRVSVVREAPAARDASPTRALPTSRRAPVVREAPAARVASPTRALPTSRRAQVVREAPAPRRAPAVREAAASRRPPVNREATASREVLPAREPAYTREAPETRESPPAREPPKDFWASAPSEPPSARNAPEDRWASAACEKPASRETSAARWDPPSEAEDSDRSDNRYAESVPRAHRRSVSRTSFVYEDAREPRYQCDQQSLDAGYRQARPQEDFQWEISRQQAYYRQGLSASNTLGRSAKLTSNGYEERHQYVQECPVVGRRQVRPKDKIWTERSSDPTYYRQADLASVTRRREEKRNFNLLNAAMNIIEELDNESLRKVELAVSCRLDKQGCER